MTKTWIVLICCAISMAAAVFSIIMAARTVKSAKRATKHARDATARTAAMRASARRQHKRGQP